MHLCDTCKKFNKCYPNNTWPTKEQREKVSSEGCKNYKELTTYEMFMSKFIRKESR